MNLRHPRMPITRRTDGYWITEVPLCDCRECGPYKHKGDAEEDRRGLRRFFRTCKLLSILITPTKTQEVA